jgi:hypothetical protein
MDWVHQVFHKSPEIAFFLSLAAGYFIGQINFGKFQLGGVGGSLLAAVVISQFGVQIDNGVKSVMFAVFIYAVGYVLRAAILQLAEPQDAARDRDGRVSRRHRADHGADLREALQSQQGHRGGAGGRGAHAVRHHRHRGRRHRAAGSSP